MENQDKIGELFRENAHKLNQGPSDETWSRIQQRLQADGPIKQQRASHRPRGRRIVLRPMSVAAGLALLIGLSAAFLWLVNSQDQQYQRQLAEAKRVLKVEDLPTITAETLPTPIVVKQELAKAYQTPERVIEEGRPEQRLVVRTNPSPVRPMPQSPTGRDSADSRMSR